MSGFIRALVRIGMATNVPEDVVVNTFYFDGDSQPGTTPTIVAQEANNRLTTFYQAIDGELLSGFVMNSFATVSYYDLADAEPRVPVLETTISLTPKAEQALPHEVAMCLSFEAVGVSGQSQKRRRGRVYIGVLPLGVLSSGRPSTAAQQTLRNAADAMAENDTGGVQWAIYSPTTRATGASLADSVHDVKSGWVDNAFDTQRRRGVQPTLREVFSS